MRYFFLTILLIVSTAALGLGQQTTFYYPHIANGSFSGAVWKTTILLTNPAAVGTNTASGSITFMKDDPNPTVAGTPLNISFTDETGASVANGNTIAFQIAGGASKKFTSLGIGAYAGGFAVVTANAPVNGTAIFSEFNSASGVLIGEAGVPSGA